MVNDVIGERWEGGVSHPAGMGLRVLAFDHDTSPERVSLPSSLH